jgi:hypothetical protein
MVLRNRIFYVFLLIFFLSGFAQAEELVSISTARGVDQKFILSTPSSQPHAAVILFAGGHGGLGLDRDGSSVKIGWGQNNFLVRAREMFSDSGFVVATVDSPGDKSKGMNAIWRLSKKHAADVQSLVEFLKSKYDLPVWLVGTSMGSFSVAGYVSHFPSGVDGIVFTSSVTRSKNDWKIKETHPNGVASVDFQSVSLPVLVVSHNDDGCDLSPSSDANKLASSFPAGRHVRVLLFDGGKEPESGPCQALSAHGFLGIERDVVSDIADFILSAEKQL